MVLCIQIYCHNNRLVTSVERTKLWCRKNNHKKPLLSRDKGVSDHVHAFIIQCDRGKNWFPRVDKTKIVCSHCKQWGHEINTCFKIHKKNIKWFEERLHARNAGRNDGVVNSGGGSSTVAAGLNVGGGSAAG